MTYRVKLVNGLESQEVDLPTIRRWRQSGLVADDAVVLDAEGQAFSAKELELTEGRPTSNRSASARLVRWLCSKNAGGLAWFLLLLSYLLSEGPVMPAIMLHHGKEAVQLAISEQAPTVAETSGINESVYDKAYFSVRYSEAVVKSVIGGTLFMLVGLIAAYQVATTKRFQRANALTLSAVWLAAVLYAVATRGEILHLRPYVVSVPDGGSDIHLYFGPTPEPQNLASFFSHPLSHNRGPAESIESEGIWSAQKCKFDT
jgi:hypothetical protein